MPPALAQVRVLLTSPRGQRGLRLAAVSLTVVYLAGLGLAIAGMRLVGEQHWLTTALLYAPRMAFLVPLPMAAIALTLWGPRRLLWALPAALWLALFPIMGLELGLGRLGGDSGASPGQPRLRLLSYNAAGGPDPRALADIVAGARADVVLVQEWKDHLQPALQPLFPGFHQHRLGQFWVASRYPIQDVYVPPLVHLPGQPARSSRFVRYRLLTPLGPVHVLNVHPASPREDLVDTASVRANSLLRLRQVENIASEAGRAQVPVIIAGDTNLPVGSWILRQTLGRYRDGFEAAGRGFGYTFPAHRPWMRIDRILSDARLRFVRVQVLGDVRASDHLAVLAELTTAP